MPDTDTFPPSGPVSVTELNRMARLLLERGLPLMQVSGEISNLVRAASGHMYFTLKDAGAQVRCTMWRNRAQLLGFRPENGMQVTVRALVTLYEVRGDFQLSVEALSRAGQGSLYEAFLQLKQKLELEGLFAPERKRPLPRFPAGIAVVTSPSAAALQDVLACLSRRAPNIPVVLYPASVQGASAPEELTQAVHTVSRRASLDGVNLLLLVRGGGSLEDLQAFNAEGLARAIAACPIPVISGVGHETDFSISDFVADQRATTPTMAAELASAATHEARQRLPQLQRLLRAAFEHQLSRREQRLDRCALRLLHPRERLQRAGRELQVLEQRLQRAAGKQLERQRTRQERLALRLHHARPVLSARQEQIDALQHRLRQATTHTLAGLASRLDALQDSLRHLDPKAVLNRGFSITRDGDGRIVRDAASVPTNALLDIELAHGHLRVRNLTQRATSEQERAEEE